MIIRFQLLHASATTLVPAACGVNSVVTWTAALRPFKVAHL
jgi:hypothetical protein